MIRQMVRLKAVALVAIVGIASSGTSQLRAAAAETPREDRAAAAPWFVQVLDGEGHVFSPPATRQDAALESVNVEQTRARIMELQKSSDPRVAARGRQALRWLEIATAKTARERHDLIRKLPVTVITTEVTDGRVGVVKTFVTRGTPRLRWFLPAGLGLTPPAEGGDADHPSGPSVNDDCYNGEPEPCMTEAEMEDLGITLAAAQAEADAQNAELAQAESEYNDYCSQNPGNCEGLEGDTPRSGPNAWESTYFACGSQLGGAAFYTGFAGYSIYAGVTSWGSAMALGGFLAAASGAAIVVGVAGAVALAGVAVYDFVSCKRSLARNPNLDAGAPLRYEPVY